MEGSAVSHGWTPPAREIVLAVSDRMKKAGPCCQGGHAGQLSRTSGRQPVAGATVRLWVFNFTTFVEKDSTTTAADGSFRFTGNPSHNIQISADKGDAGRSEHAPGMARCRDCEIVHGAGAEIGADRGPSRAPLACDDGGGIAALRRGARSRNR